MLPPSYKFTENSPEEELPRLSALSPFSELHLQPPLHKIHAHSLLRRIPIQHLLNRNLWSILTPVLHLKPIHILLLHRRRIRILVHHLQYRQILMSQLHLQYSRTRTLRPLHKQTHMPLLLLILMQTQPRVTRTQCRLEYPSNHNDCRPNPRYVVLMRSNGFRLGKVVVVLQKDLGPKTNSNSRTQL